MRQVIASAAAILILLGGGRAWAEWTENGVVACAANNKQEYPKLITDSSGGAIITWQDLRNGVNYDVYAQRVDANGSVLWTAGGVPICTATANQLSPRIVSDGSGGAIIWWQDYRGGAYCDIYAQRIAANGTVLWTADGIAVRTASDVQPPVGLVGDGSGGAIIAWYEYRSDIGGRIYAQRVSAGGSVMWAADGVAVCPDGGGYQGGPQIIADDAGGAIIVWQDSRNGSTYDIYAQRIDSGGSLLWTGQGAVICSADETQNDLHLVTDGSAGAIIAWQDYRYLDWITFIQRIDAGGSTLWAPDGVLLSDPISQLVADGVGGAIVIASNATTINAQRVHADGSIAWAAYGVTVCTGKPAKAALAPDGSGGAIITWIYSIGTPYNDNFDLYAQRVAADGSTAWQTNGLPVCTANGWEQNPDIVSNDSGDAMIVWQDSRRDRDDWNIYIQRVMPCGCVGLACPEIAGTTDIRPDQGGWVRIHLNRALYDRSGESRFPVTGYNIWRRIPGVSGSEVSSFEGAAGRSVSDARADFLADPKSSSDIILSRAQAAALGLPAGAWESLGFHAALQQEYYDFAVPTRNDSMGSKTPWETYVVTAHTTSPGTYFVSEPDSGYSVDNLVPGEPQGLAGERQYSPEGLRLTWNGNADSDLWRYALYRGLTEDFVPGPGTRIAYRREPDHFDSGWRPGSGYYYKVSAIDVHGNESGFALLTPDGVTGTETPKAPAATYLAQNFPNPFNPTTRIAFGLSAPGHVSLRIYDAAGRLVRVLAEGNRPAARYAEVWDGKDAGGQAVASGIYFCRLDAGSFTQTKKMILLR